MCLKEQKSEGDVQRERLLRSTMESETDTLSDDIRKGGITIRGNTSPSGGKGLSGDVGSGKKRMADVEQVGMKKKKKKKVSHVEVPKVGDMIEVIWAIREEKEVVNVWWPAVVEDAIGLFKRRLRYSEFDNQWVRGNEVYDGVEFLPGYFIKHTSGDRVGRHKWRPRVEGGGELGGSKKSGDEEVGVVKVVKGAAEGGTGRVMDVGATVKRLMGGELEKISAQYMARLDEVVETIGRQIKEVKDMTENKIEEMYRKIEKVEEQCATSFAMLETRTSCVEKKLESIERKLSKSGKDILKRNLRLALLGELGKLEGTKEQGKGGVMVAEKRFCTMGGLDCSLVEFEELIRDWKGVLGKDMEEIWTVGSPETLDTGSFGVTVEGFMEMCTCIGVKRTEGKKLMMGMYEETTMASAGYVLGVLGETGADTALGVGEIGRKGDEVVVLGLGRTYLKNVAEKEVRVEARSVQWYTEGGISIGGVFESRSMPKEDLLEIIRDPQTWNNEFGFELRGVGGSAEKRGDVGKLYIRLPMVVVGGAVGKGWVEGVFRRETVFGVSSSSESD